MVGERVFPLAWHVAYWDYLGWPDPFANVANEARQGRYQTAFGNNGLYTPEMVINGREFLSSTDPAAVDAEVSGVLQEAVTVSTTLWLESTSDAVPLQVGYAVEGAAAGAELWIALVERGIVRPIGAGENQGRTLTHDSVVRVFDIVASPVEGVIGITPPDDVVVSEASLIGFVQDPTSMFLSGATDLDLSE